MMKKQARERLEKEREKGLSRTCICKMRRVEEEQERQ